MGEEEYFDLNEREGDLVFPWQPYEQLYTTGPKSRPQTLVGLGGDHFAVNADYVRLCVVLHRK